MHTALRAAPESPAADLEEDDGSQYLRAEYEDLSDDQVYHSGG